MIVLHALVLLMELLAVLLELPHRYERFRSWWRMRRRVQRRTARKK